LAVLVTGLALARLAYTAPHPEVSHPEAPPSGIAHPEAPPSGVAHPEVPRPEVFRPEPACV
jgi:hypothetical protein